MQIKVKIVESFLFLYCDGIINILYNNFVNKMIEKKKVLLNTLKQQVLSLKMELEQLNRPADQRKSVPYQSA